MVHEINTLVKALIKNEKKYVKLQNLDKKKLRESRKIIRDQQSELDSMSQEV